jgi:replicative superfamily II helicase
MAAVRALASRRKAIMLFPLKSLAEEYYRFLAETYQPLGVKCLIATGDHPENDRRFADGDYQLAVAIYEKFDLLLTVALDSLKNVGLLVIDELQMLAEKGRGAVLERLLTKVLASQYRPGLIALSAVLGEEAAERLADWLGAEVVEETSRPVDLLCGVAAGGSFQYRSYNSGEEGRTPFACARSGEDALDAFIEQLKADRQSTLVFVKSRSDTVNMAFRLAAAVNWPPAKTALTRLGQEEPSFLTRSLCQAMGRGVAFHNSDLSPHQRAIVEQAFINKEIKVLFSTTTLAMGVNLPAGTVYLETVKYDLPAYDGRPALVPVSRAEFDNMAGRAGRLGLDNGEPGRAIVLAESEFDRDILWQQYISSVEPRLLESAFGSLPLEDWVLNLVVCRLATEVVDLEKILSTTYQAASGREVGDIDRAVRLLSESGLVALDASGRMTPTAPGRAAAGAGLLVSQSSYLMSQLKDRYPETAFGWTALVLSLPGCVLPPGILTRAELAENMPVRLLYRRFDQAVEEAAYLFPRGGARQPLDFKRSAGLKALLLLEEWSRLTPVQRLEESYQIHLGQIMALGDTSAHLLTALAALISACDRESPAPPSLRGRAFSLRYGLPVAIETLHRHLRGILDRSDFARLHRAGLTDLADLSEMSSEELGRIIENSDKCQLLCKKLGTLKEEVSMGAAQLASSPMVSVEPDSIEIDGSFDRERYLVRINGFPVYLTGKSFKYLAKLAWSRLHRDSGWIYKEDIEIGFNQARYLYRMKNEIGAGLNSPWPIIENNRLGYYRLSIAPEKIHINAENLKNHYDVELRQLTADSGLIPPGDSAGAVH